MQLVIFSIRNIAHAMTQIAVQIPNTSSEHEHILQLLNPLLQFVCSECCYTTCFTYFGHSFSLNLLNPKNGGIILNTNVYNGKNGQGHVLSEAYNLNKFLIHYLAAVVIFKSGKLFTSNVSIWPICQKMSIKLFRYAFGFY